jgi:hypothetical protein
MGSSWTWVAAPTAIYAFVKEKNKRIGLLEMNGKKTYCKGVSSNTPEAD